MTSLFNDSNVRERGKEGDIVPVAGFDFSAAAERGQQDITVAELFDGFRTTGFSGSKVSQCADVLSEMLQWERKGGVSAPDSAFANAPVAPTDDTPSSSPDEQDELDTLSAECAPFVRTTVFMGYTSNMISCGVRESLLFLAKNRLVDVIVTTAGGIEEDFIKCIAPHVMGDFSLDGSVLRRAGINRIGNMLVPNDSYCSFEDWLLPVVNKMHDEVDASGGSLVWTPSSFIRRLGEAINDERSVYYWAARNNIPVFCPALTDGSIGDMLYFHTYKRPGFVLDIVQDVRAINDIAIKAKRTGMLILGGGVCKHHVCNANLFRSGADSAVFVNTASEFDGSDSGAMPSEAVSWGKIKIGGESVKLHADASLVFPLLVAKSFFPEAQARRAAGLDPTLPPQPDYSDVDNMRDWLARMRQTSHAATKEAGEAAEGTGVAAKGETGDASPSKGSRKKGGAKKKGKGKK
jgi:deoxyhypusine synthase